MYILTKWIFYKNKIAFSSAHTYPKLLRGRRESLHVKIVMVENSVGCHMNYDITTVEDSVGSLLN
jgi:hypothetical protein